MITFIGEFLGTSLLIFMGNGVVANVRLGKTNGSKLGWIIICAGWGFAVAVSVSLSGWISGAHINPAVTFGKALLGHIAWSEVPYYMLGQFLGAFTGAVLVWLCYLPDWSQTLDADSKLKSFCTKPLTRRPFVNLLSEVFATAILLIGVLAIGHLEENITFGLKPYLNGFLIVGIGLALGKSTVFSINPARDLGPRIAHSILPIPQKRDSDWSYAWIPIVGPILGSALGVLIYESL